MIRDIFDTINKEFSGTNAKELIGEIAKNHRIQSSPGFRAAAKLCQHKLEEYGVPKIKLHSYPATGKNAFWGCPVPKEWSIKKASLELIKPDGSREVLCRFFENPCSVIQRSKGTPNEGITAEVVILPKGLSEKEMEKYNIEKKFILTDEPDLKKLRKIAVGRLGAAGIIYDYVTELPPFRTRSNFPTARRYTSFWYGTKGEEGEALGFVLSAEQGNRLRKLIEENNEKGKEEKKNKKVYLHAKVDAEFYEGEMEVLEFCIPGKKKSQEVLAMAHLCHPKPGAVDNASGCGTLIEMARSLQQLILSGKIPQPERTVRFLLMAEFTGTLAYLATNEKKIAEFIAGINLDMVGADQTLQGRTLVLERTPSANPSFVNDVLSTIFEESTKQVSNFHKTSAYAVFKYALDQPFSGGSDHLIFNSPDIGVGTPMLIQWPDRYYHTGEDTIEKVSSEMLQIVGGIACTYCYFLANAKTPELFWIAQEIVSKGKNRLTQHGRAIINNLTERIIAIDKKEQEEKEGKRKKEEAAGKAMSQLDNRLLFREDIELTALNSLLKLVQKSEKEYEELESFIQKLATAIKEHGTQTRKNTKYALERLLEKLVIKPRTPAIGEKRKEGKIIPHKVFRGAFTGLLEMDFSMEDMQEKKEILDRFKEGKKGLAPALLWINGERTIGEIAGLVKCELGIDITDFLIEIFSFYEKKGLLKLSNKG
jgi:hypothetical protein